MGTIADDHDWSSESTVFPTVEAVAVYRNSEDELVIRQMDSMGGEDRVIVIPRHFVKAFKSAVRKA